MRKYALIALGGAAGAMLRYAIGALAMKRFGPRFPVGTLSINITACFLIGFVLEYLNAHAHLSTAWRYMIAVGFIGAYSTFSTFEYEAWSDVQRGAPWTAMLYVVVSLVGGYAAVSVGATSARALH